MELHGFVSNAKLVNPYVIVVFSKSQLSLQKWFLMLWFWAREYPVTEAAVEAEIGHPAPIDIYQWLQVCSTKLIQSPVILGGPCKVVQVDEFYSTTSLK